ncbi:MAG: hypothetical protein JRE64_20325 [Deltaproteobacteria bacterium]|nr:hypothetical protein [Deltaproteobacteria bacterium]
MLFFEDSKIKILLKDTVSIDIYTQIPGITTSKIFEKKLYTIKEDSAIRKIIHSLKLKKMHKAVQCKASNYIIFNLRDDGTLEADMDPEGTWLRVTTPKGVEFYQPDNKSVQLLLNHLEKAKLLYNEEFTSE